MLRFGVIGAGWFASRRHLPEIVAHPEAELAALCRRSPEPMQRLADHFGVPETYTDPETMLAKARLDVVLVASPHDLHHAHAAAALDAGCHVLLEKPMTLRTTEAEDLVARAEQAGRLLEVAYNPPFWSHTVWLRERVQTGDLGAVEAVDLRWTGDVRALFGRTELPADLPGIVRPTLFRGDPEAMGGGYFIDGGSHQVAEVGYVTGERIIRLHALFDAVPSDTRCVVGFELERGGRGTLVGVADSAFAERRVLGVYCGSEATAVVRGMPFTITWEVPGREAQVINERDLPPAPQPVVSFIDAILGRASQRSPGTECIEHVRVVEATYRAASTGQAQQLGR